MSEMHGDCPRCGRPLVGTDETRPALSRYDNTTYVCSSCGIDEAMWNQQRFDPLPPPDQPAVWYADL